jgi:nicotinamide-nucleotide amidase
MSTQDDLIDELSRAAADAGITIAVAESLSSGALSSAIGRGEGAGEWFAGGVVAYQMSSKHRVLGVDEDVDPCSDVCARQLAGGVRGLFGADVSASITGLGGPDPQDGHRPGEVHIGVSSARGTSAVVHSFDGEPAEVIAQSVEAALRALLTELRA